MNCEWAEQVALLEPPTPELHAHLASCAECRELLAELEADQALLQQPPEVPDGVVAGAVLRRIATRRWYRYAAAAAIFLAAIWYDQPPRREDGPASSPLVTVPREATSVPPTAPKAQFAKRTPRPQSRPKPQQANPDKLMAEFAAMLEPASTATASADTPVLITTQTADPDVVIVLVPEKTGDEQ